MAQFGQGWVFAVAAAFAPVAGATGAELDREGLLASGARDWTIGAPHVSQ
jgi:hypothetical protein